jgi:hypothetical protein
MNPDFNHMLPCTWDHVSWGTSCLVPWKTFQHIVFHVLYSHIVCGIKTCFHWLGFKSLHNFCLYLLLDQATIDLAHYHLIHNHVLWSIILCNQSGHHAQEDWVKFKHAFKNACCIKNIAHYYLTKNKINSCLTFFLHWVVFLFFMEVRIKWMHLLNHILLYTFNDVILRPSNLVPWKYFKHRFFYGPDSTYYT